MGLFVRCALGRGLTLALLLIFLLRIDAGASPWQALQDRYPPGASLPVTVKRAKGPDPWARLRAIYLLFSKETETAALTDPRAAREVSGQLHRALHPYAAIIHEASRRFDIPPEIIGAVIMAESGGDPMAQAQTSTAKGLMQTIAGTFRDSREALLSQGIVIADDPFNPHASIMAGAWYLDRMYAQAALDRGHAHLSRRDIASWRDPVEYYYAGPGNGRKNEKRVIMYAGGRRIIIDKLAYSRKVLQWAEIMSKAG
jgi:soluble lytic murein transglycosylase-like protein